MEMNGGEQGGMEMSEVEKGLSEMGMELRMGMEISKMEMGMSQTADSLHAKSVLG